MEFYEKTESEKEIFNGKIIKVKVQDVILPDGKKSKREIVNHPGGVAILAFKDEETIYLVEQFRKPFEKTMIELPAGKLDYGEDPEECGRRELEEEIGFKAANFKYLGKIVSSPGFCDECIYLYKAWNLEKGYREGDEGGFIRTKEVKVKDALALIYNGEITDAKTICAFMLNNKGI